MAAGCWGELGVSGVVANGVGNHGGHGRGGFVLLLNKNGFWTGGPNPRGKTRKEETFEKKPIRTNLLKEGGFRDGPPQKVAGEPHSKKTIGPRLNSQRTKRGLVGGSCPSRQSLCGEIAADSRVGKGWTTGGGHPRGEMYC